MTRAVFRLPPELIIEILACFGDPRRNILRAKEESLLCPDVELVQQLTVIRRFTMTCWHLRNILFPVLWKHVEGCTLIHFSSLRPPVAPNKFFVTSNGLYPQCSYLLLNPTIGAYVQCVFPHIRRFDSCRTVTQGLFCGSGLSMRPGGFDWEIC